jgi:hypothetical protein
MIDPSVAEASLTAVNVGYHLKEKVRGASPRDAPTLKWEGRERGLEEGVTEGAGRRT